MTTDATIDAAREPSPWLTVPEAAARAKCSTRLIYDVVARGKLKASRLAARRELRIHREWLDAWIESSATILNPEAPGRALAPPPARLRR